MFLNQLVEEEKIAFLGLCIHISKSDTNFSEEEYAMIDAYKSEMHLDCEIGSPIEFDKIVEVFSKSDIRTKKIVLFESLGVAYSDDYYDEEEQKLIHNFAQKIGLSEADISIQENLMEEYLHVVKKIAIYIN